MLSERAWRLLACPACGASLVKLAGAAVCERCDTRYPFTGEQPDLRLRTPKNCHLAIELGGENADAQARVFEPLASNPTPQVHVDSAQIHGNALTYGNRLTPEFISYFPRASQPGGFMLDLGCGDREMAEICASTNLEYVGMDYSGTAPDLLGDAHALPFRDDSFDFILSIAVLEHLRYPLVATREAYRVLKPGGLFIGSVAFLEPFHMDSYYHHTHLGTFTSLASAGFDVEHVVASAEWSGIQALAGMSLFPRMPQFASNLLTLPLRAMHRLWWRLGHALRPRETSSEHYRTLSTTGGFRFIARKPVSASPAPVTAGAVAEKTPPPPAIHVEAS